MSHPLLLEDLAHVIQAWSVLEQHLFGANVNAQELGRKMQAILQSPAWEADGVLQDLVRAKDLMNQAVRMIKLVELTAPVTVPIKET